MKSVHRVIVRASVLLVLAGSGLLLWAGPGFGTLRKKSLELQVRHPAVVRLANTTVAFRGSSTNREYSGVEASLLATLETELVSNERTLVKKDKPEDAKWVLDLKVTGFSAPNSTTRTDTTNRSNTTYSRWIGSLNVAYQVLDHSGRVHDASNISKTYDREFNSTQVAGGGGTVFGLRVPGARRTPETIPHSTEDVKQILIKEVVQQIAANLGNTSKMLEVQVAGGEEHMNRAADFLEQKLWQRAVDELQRTSALPKAEDESYRQYDLGLAYEAMAYDSKSTAEQRANIFKAAEFYDKALELNPGEKYFVVTVARTKDAIARYKELDRMKSEDKLRSTGVQTQSKTIRVAEVINMVTSGVPENQILEAIRDSPLDFNPKDVETMIALAKAKVPNSIQNEMRKKVGASLLPGSKAK